MSSLFRVPLVLALPAREIRSLKGKSNASARWVRRQWNDPIVKQAKREGLRSRAAIKLRELNAVSTWPACPGRMAWMC